ncbi:CG15464 [Drosophila busckii]|uniref:CG15464 n=1 Tax=Drosophila busckii TaxID=30019 RepID=A0A0M4EHV4_DROBS|nr:CG15464 [Drosophila busckii]
MDSLERLMRAAPLPRMLTNSVVATAAAAAASAAASAAAGVKGVVVANLQGQGQQRALVHASLAAATVGRKGRHLTGTFCLTGDTMEGIIQCLVFLKAFSVSVAHTYKHTHIHTHIHRE